jgi:tRNA A-37 threonylcarbamoyl transferase component Bud32
MSSDLTALDSYGWEAIRKCLNQRVVMVKAQLVPSNDNRVWIVETDVRPVVVKLFLSGRCGEEFESLVRARQAGVDVPLPLHTEGDYMVMEYISGEPCDWLINKMFSSPAAAGIGSWLADFHEKLGTRDRPVVMADAVLPNFVMKDKRVFGMDLEKSGPGDPLEDLGQMCSSILASEPFFTPIKFDLCMQMLLSYEKKLGVEAVESVRPFVAKCLRISAQSRPLFRRTFLKAAEALEIAWPKLA